MDQLRQRRRALERQRTDAADAEEWRRKGDLVLAYGYNVPPGSDSIEADGETIKFDPQESVAANADTYFDTYKRKKRAQGGSAGTAAQSKKRVCLLRTDGGPAGGRGDAHRRSRGAG